MFTFTFFTVGMASTMKMVSYDMKIKENDILILTSDGVGDISLIY